MAEEGTVPMELSLVIEKLGKLADLGNPVSEGDPCILWINSLVAFAYCSKVEPDFAIGWYVCRFHIFDRLPPIAVNWKINDDHLAGHRFTVNDTPVAIIRLNFKDVTDEEIREIDWDDFIGGGQVP